MLQLRFSLCFVLNWFNNRTGTSDGRECAQKKSVCCSNLTIFGNFHSARRGQVKFPFSC